MTIQTSDLEALGLINLPTLLVESETPTDWLIEDLLPAGETVLLAGASHSGKTYVLLDMALAVASGRPWLGRFDTGRPRSVLYCPSEGRRGIGKRLRSAIDHHYRYDAPEGDFYLYGNSLDLTRPESALTLLKAVEATGVSLVIVDVLRDATPGVEENSAAMGDALGLLRDIGHATGATFIVAHHTGKDASKGSRGHSSLKDKADQEVIVTGTPLADGSGGILTTTVTLKNSKNRNEDNWGTLSLDLRKPHETYPSPVIMGEAWKASQGPETDNQAMLSVLSAMVALEPTDNRPTTYAGCRFADVAEYLGVSKPAVQRTMGTLVDKGFADRDTSGMAHLFTLTDKGRRATDNRPTTGEVVASQTDNQPAAPYGCGGVVDGPPTAVEQLLDIARQEDEVDEDGGEVVLDLEAIRAAR